MGFWEDVGGALAAGPALMLAGGAETGSGILKIFGDTQAAQAQKEAASANQLMAEKQQAFAKFATQQNESAFQQIAARQLGSIRAAYGASGVDLSGTPQDVREYAASVNAQKLLNIGTQGTLQQQTYENAAKLYFLEGQNAGTEGLINAASDALGTAGKLASTYSGAFVSAPVPAGGGFSGGYSGYGSGGGSGAFLM